MLITLILWRNAQPAPQLTQPTAPEASRVMASLVTIPHLPDAKAKRVITPHKATALAKWAVCEPGTCTYEQCLYLPTSTNAPGSENRNAKLCVGCPPENPPGFRPGTYALRSLRIVQQQRYCEQWFGLDRV